MTMNNDVSGISSNVTSEPVSPAATTFQEPVTTTTVASPTSIEKAKSFGKIAVNAIFSNANKFSFEIFLVAFLVALSAFVILFPKVAMWSGLTVAFFSGWIAFLGRWVNNLGKPRI